MNRIESSKSLSILARASHTILSAGLTGLTRLTRDRTESDVRIQDSETTKIDRRHHGELLLLAIVCTCASTTAQHRIEASPQMHQSNGVKHSSHSSHNAASRSNETQETNVRSFQLQWWSIIIHRLPILLRLVSCLCLVAGLLVSNWVLHTHEECDMTYSRRQFLPLSMNTTNTSHSSQSQYRFWKFIDQRDPRYRRFVTSSANGDSDKSLTGTDWCNNNNNNNNNNTTVAVLYIPGHGGSYEQSRSLGAHGLQLTSARDMRQQRRVVSALQRNEWSGATDSDNTDSGNTDNGNTDKGNKEDSFIFDVYAVDFGEEGGAFHGDLILEQGRFVGEAVLKLVQDCHLPSIVLVAHSMGGFSARLASILVPETRPHIRNIVTLGTPHAGAWNPSLYHLQEHMNMNMNGNYNDNDKDTSVQDNTAMISIAGGLRDEMILPEACHVHTSSATTVRPYLLCGRLLETNLSSLKCEAAVCDVWSNSGVSPPRIILLRNFIFHIYIYYRSWRPT
jgi:hypothetical protein